AGPTPHHATPTAHRTSRPAPPTTAPPPLHSPLSTSFRQRRMTKPKASKKVGTDAKLDPVAKIQDGRIEKPKAEKKAKPADAKPKKIKDPNEPKAPANTYVMFTRERGEAVRKANPGLNNKEITALLSAEWKALDKDGKQKYVDARQVLVQQYEAELAKYKASKPADAAADAEMPDAPAAPAPAKPKAPRKKKAVAPAPAPSEPAAVVPDAENEEPAAIEAASMHEEPAPPSAGSAGSTGSGKVSAGTRIAGAGVRPLLSPASTAGTPQVQGKKPAAPAGRRVGANLLLVKKDAPAAPPAPVPEPAEPVVHPAEEIERPTVSESAAGFLTAGKFPRTPSQVKVDSRLIAQSARDDLDAVPNDDDAASDDQIVADA
ncbi:hypothetical protein DFJ74DRAFT_744185, partial [Hyaloraphidium curvatum]